MEHCAASVKTMFSKSITQILPFCDNSYTHQCRFSMPTKQFYFHWKQVETGDDILQILKMVENPSNSLHLEKISSHALSSASCCNISNDQDVPKLIDSVSLSDECMNKNENDWVSKLPAIKFTINSACSESTGFHQILAG